MGLNIYKVRVVLLTPAVIPSRRARTGYLGSLDYIPASTLRGALVSAMYRDGIVSEDFLKLEASEPTIIASPAYPVVNDEEAKPAHPFIFICKRCKLENNEPYFVDDEALKGIMEGREPEVKVECAKGHRAVKSLHYKPVVLIHGKEKTYKSAELSRFRYVSVNISKDRAAAVRGRLYSYEALGEGQEFWAFVFSRKEHLELYRMRLRIGRGISRGMGDAVISKVEEVDMDWAIDRVREAIRGGALLLRSLSPLLGGEESLGSSAYPTKIDLRRIAELIGVSASGSLRLEKAYGRVIPFDAGWDMVRRQLRPRFYAKAQGSLVKTSLDNVNGEYLYALAALGFVGTGEYYNGDMPITGINILEPLEVFR